MAITPSLNASSRPLPIAIFVMLKNQVNLKVKK
jgi:hypothetical protein